MQHLHLRLRYLSALLLIALLTSCSAWLFFSVLEQQQNDAEQINVSGRQRMLSQKIALYVNQLETSKDSDEATRDRELLQSALDTFEQSHEFLTQDSGDLSPELHALYFRGKPSLDKLVKNYVYATRHVLNGGSGGLVPVHFSRDETETLLGKLDAVVTRLETEASERVSVLKNLELSVWIISLLLLALEARFIFFPMEVAIKEHFEQLKQKIQDIRTLDREKQELEKIASLDPLTGLYSLNAAREFLEQLTANSNQHQHRLAVLFLDLDNFKPINDRYGHDVGDLVLIETARRIHQQLRSQDIACRIGGDEFLLVIEKLEDSTQLEHLCKRLLHAVSKPLNCNGHDIQVFTSIGCAIFPEHAIDASELRKFADEAMYEAKRNGKNSFSIYGAGTEHL